MLRKLLSGKIPFLKIRKNQLLENFKTRFPEVKIRSQSIIKTKVDSIETVSFDIDLPKGGVLKIGDNIYSQYANHVSLTEAMSKDIKVEYYLLDRHNSSQSLVKRTNTSHKPLFVVYDTTIPVMEFLLPSETTNYDFLVLESFGFRQVDARTFESGDEESLSGDIRVKYLFEDYPLISYLGTHLRYARLGTSVAVVELELHENQYLWFGDRIYTSKDPYLHMTKWISFYDRLQPKVFSMDELGYVNTTTNMQDERLFITNENDFCVILLHDNVHSSMDIIQPGEKFVIHGNTNNFRCYKLIDITP
jgi:hypothetical protein